MTNNNYTVFNALVDIIASPGKALDHVREHTGWLWAPLLIVIVMNSAALAYYYGWVDFDWLVDETVRALPPEQRAEAEPAVRGFMKPTTSIVTSVAAVVIMTFLIYLIQAAYLHLANKLTAGAEVRFGQWFSFSAWTAFPGIFSALAIFLVIFLADSNRLAQGELSPLSMNSLFIGAEMGDPWFTWGNSLTIINFWMLALMIIGYSRWTGSSLLKSAITVCLPWVLIFGVWAALI